MGWRMSAASIGAARGMLMQCFVYKSRRQSDTYLFLAQADDFERVPAALRAGLGALERVLEFDLTPERRLARGDAGVVTANLSARGFHIQFPPDRFVNPIDEA